MDNPFSYDYVRLLPEQQIDLHQAPSWELSYVRTGAGTRLIGDTTEGFRSGEVVLIPPDIPHCWYFDSEVTEPDGNISNITVNFQSRVMDELESLFPSLGHAMTLVRSRRDAVLFSGERAARLIELLESMRPLPSAERVPLFIRLLLIIAEGDGEQIVGRHRTVDRERERLDRIRVYVICNVRREITLDDAARHVGMNRAAFCTFFKRVTGKTFVNYLNEYRVGLACRHLGRSRMSVSEICYHVGFNDVPYFNRLFKRLKGCTPTAFRDAAQAEISDKEKE